MLHIEPGIFEWLGWYQLGLPKWFTPAELKSHGFNIDETYKPFIPISKFNMEEDIVGYYKRSGDTAKAILKKHENDGKKYISCENNTHSYFKKTYKKNFLKK